MVDSANTPPGEDSAAPPGDGEDRALTARDKKLAIADMLEGKTADQDDGNDDQDGKPSDGEDQQKDGKLDSLDAVAAKLGVEKSDLYELAITQPGDGEDRVTIGQLADIAKDKGQLELDRLEFDERVQKREADLMRAQQEVTEIVSLLPKAAISKDLLNAVAKRMAQTQDKERGQTLLAIPEWKDQAREDADRLEMSKHLEPYGFAGNYLDSIHDHRTLKYIRDNMQREGNMKRALEAVTKLRKGDGKKPGKKAPAAKKPGPARRAAGRRSETEKVEAVAELLRTAN